MSDPVSSPLLTRFCTLAGCRLPVVQTGMGWVAAFVYCLGAALRLARFNTHVEVADKRFFQGMPSPAAACLVAGRELTAPEGSQPLPAGAPLVSVGEYPPILRPPR